MGPPLGQFGFDFRNSGFSAANTAEKQANHKVEQWNILLAFLFFFRKWCLVFSGVFYINVFAVIQ
jgi:hypothetical protein